MTTNIPHDAWYDFDECNDMMLGTTRGIVSAIADGWLNKTIYINDVGYTIQKLNFDLTTELLDSGYDLPNAVFDTDNRHHIIIDTEGNMSRWGDV